jgi:hypothetical protein
MLMHRRRDALCSPMYLETTAAWYILGVPAPEYRALFAPFFRAHRIAQVLVCALLRDQRTHLDDFISELKLTDCTLMGDASGDNTRTLDMRDVHDAVCFPSSFGHLMNDSPWCGERSRQSLRRSTHSMTPWRAPYATPRSFGTSSFHNLALAVAGSRRQSPYANSSTNVCTRGACRIAFPRASATSTLPCCGRKTNIRLMLRRASLRWLQVCSASSSSSLVDGCRRRVRVWAHARISAREREAP